MKIIRYTPNTQPSSKVKGFFDIEVDLIINGNIIPKAFEIKGFKLIQGEKGFFIGASSKKYEKNGETKYLDDVWIADNIKESLIEIALAEVDPVPGKKEDLLFPDGKPLSIK